MRAWAGAEGTESARLNWGREGGFMYPFLEAGRRCDAKWDPPIGVGDAVAIVCLRGCDAIIIGESTVSANR